MLRLAITADLHHDVARSRESAEALAKRFDQADADGLLVVGDTAISDGDVLERALSLFADDGRPRLFVPGNHELWSKQQQTPVDELLQIELPRRVRAAGWHWLPGDPWRLTNGWSVVGTLGWYDHAFASVELGLPTRFYDAGLSPAVAAWLGRMDLAPKSHDVPEAFSHFVARWNDKRFIHGMEADAAFALARLSEFNRDLDAAASSRGIVAAVHVVPMPELLPRVPPGDIPANALKYAFARAFLGSPKFGEAALTRKNVRHLMCGHSHTQRTFDTGTVRCENIGSTYVEKRLVTVDLR